MILLFIPLIASCVLICVSDGKKWIQIVSSAVVLVFLVVLALGVSRNDALFEKLPFTSIEDSEEIAIGTDGVMYVESSQSAFLENEYFLSDDFDAESLQSWLNDTSKPVYLHIKSKDSLVWSYNLGMCNEATASTIEELYNSWKANGVVPREKVRYKFIWFYFEV